MKPRRHVALFSRRGDFGDRQPTLATQGEKAKMGKSQSEGGASTYIYGLIFVLYAGIAVVLFIYMMHKRYLMYFKQQSRKVLWVVGRPITFFYSKTENGN